jgi:hypothetical protein
MTRKRPPTLTVGFVIGEPMAGLYVKVVDDYPGGIYVYWSEAADFAGEGWDNWFENWSQVEAFFEDEVGPVNWVP